MIVAGYCVRLIHGYGNYYDLDLLIIQIEFDEGKYFMVYLDLMDRDDCISRYGQYPDHAEMDYYNDPVHDDDYPH
jgi:hypothetical protein